jgi:hypothetical protein
VYCLRHSPKNIVIDYRRQYNPRARRLGPGPCVLPEERFLVEKVLRSPTSKKSFGVIMQDYVFALAAISALASAVAAMTSLVQARGATHANEVNVYLRLMEDYGSPAMQEALLALGRYWRERKEGAFANAGEAWLADSQRDEEVARTVRRHARVVSHFFSSAARMYEGGFISRKLLRLLISRPGLNVYYDVVAPINMRRSPKGETFSHIRTLKKVLPKYGDGFY